MIAYKVVYAINLERKIFKSVLIDNACSLIYVIGKTTYPMIPGSKIYLYKTLKDAKKFAESPFDKDKDYYILKGIAKGNTLKGNTMIFDCRNEKIVTLFWKDPVNFIAADQTPEGTICSESFLPEKVISF